MITAWEIKDKDFADAYPIIIRKATLNGIPRSHTVVEVYETDNLIKETWKYNYYDFSDFKWIADEVEYYTPEAAQFVADLRLLDMGVTIERPFDFIRVRQKWFFEKGKSWDDID